MTEFKQVIVVRADIQMSKGKLAAQVAHAAVDSTLRTLEVKPEWVRVWLQQGQKKVVLRCESAEELIKIAQKANELGLVASVIYDAGRTELEPGTLTAVGIGPAPSSVIDKVTGDLKLL